MKQLNQNIIELYDALNKYEYTKKQSENLTKILYMNDLKK